MFLKRAFLLLAICCYSLFQLISTAAVTATASLDRPLIEELQVDSVLPLDPSNTRWIINNQKIQVVSIDAGKLVTWEIVANQWSETNLFKPEGISFTSLDLFYHPQGRAVLIAGTTEPGFIYLYEYDHNGWMAKSFDKYLWSTIRMITAGYFSQNSKMELIAQTDDGYLYYFQVAENSFDLIWKSPAPWRRIVQCYPVDLDQDSFAEIVVIYQTGGLAALKVIDNKPDSVWANYPWGKVLAKVFGDFNNDGRPELLLTTTQKISYTLAYSDKRYQFKQASLKFDYLVENIFLPKETSTKLMVTSDTAGLLHLLEYLPAKGWLEKKVYRTGRIAKMIAVTDRHLLLWGVNRQLYWLDLEEGS